MPYIVYSLCSMAGDCVVSTCCVLWSLCVPVVFSGVCAYLFKGVARVYFFTKALAEFQHVNCMIVQIWEIMRVACYIC